MNGLSERVSLFRWLFYLVLFYDVYTFNFRHWNHKGEFYISHIEWLFGMETGVVNFMVPKDGFTMEILEHTAGLLSLLCACDIGYSFCSVALAVVYNFVYFSSTIDGYQHHYLIAMVLWILCFLRSRTRRSESDKPTKLWPIRLLVVFMAMVYFWTSVNKLDSEGFIDGTLMRSKLLGSSRRVHSLFKWISISVLRDPGLEWTLWCFVSLGCIAVEMFLSVGLPIAFHTGNKILCLVVSILGLSLHTSIIISGFRIRYFSFYMFIFYILFIPIEAVRWIRKKTQFEHIDFVLRDL